MLKFPRKVFIEPLPRNTPTEDGYDQLATAPSVAAIFATKKETKDKATCKKAMVPIAQQ